MTHGLDDALMRCETLHLHQLGCARSTACFFYLLVLALPLVSSAGSFLFGGFQVAFDKKLPLLLMHWVVAQAVALRALVGFLPDWSDKCDLLQGFGSGFLEILRLGTCCSRIVTCIWTRLLVINFTIDRVG